MRELLQRWATAEPGKCEKSIGDTFIVEAVDVRHYVESDNLGERNLAWIQWAVQEAIVNQGWYPEMYHTPETGYEAVVEIPSKAKAKAYSDSSFAEALLSAYLEVLEALR